MAKITTREIEEMIRRKMKEKGLPDTEIKEEIVEQIKEKVKEAAQTTSYQETEQDEPEDEPKEEQEDVVVDVSTATPTETPGELPSPVTQTTEENPQAEEFAEKQGELKEKERQLSEKEIELQQRELALQQKEEATSYKPELPKMFDKIGSEKMFVFDIGDLNAGGESLTNVSLRLVSNPDETKTMNDIWLEKGKKEAEVYLAKFEKVGTISFDPFQGISKFEEKRIEEQPIENVNNEKQDLSELPNSDFIDSVEPIKDVTQPLNKDMQLNPVDMERLIKDKVEEILKGHFTNTQ